MDKEVADLLLGDEHLLLPQHAALVAADAAGPLHLPRIQHVQHRLKETMCNSHSRSRDIL